jgi:transcriptional regulator with XRE-family HTH domain
MQDIIAAVKAAMNEKGWTRYKLAKELGVKNASGVYRWLAGQQGIGYATAEKALKLLGLEITAKKGDLNE